MKLIVFGLSITSSWGNGHATTFRGLLKELAGLGYDCTFLEKDVEWYASNRDLWEAEYADILLYSEWDDIGPQASELVRAADIVLLGSYCPEGIRIADWLPEAAPEALKVYYDIDTPITLSAFAASGAAEYLRPDQIPLFDLVLSFTGGPALTELEQKYGAKRTGTLYCAIDPAIHCPLAPVAEFQCDLGYMGTYASDRQPAVEAFLIEPARRLPQHRFVLAGPQYPPMHLPPNVAHHIHVPPSEHASFYCSNGMTLNITRTAMRKYGYAPSVRLFEAAGCGTCIVSDIWPGIETFLEPGKEILLAKSTEDICTLLTRLHPEQKDVIGAAARERVLREDTYAVRARQFDEQVRAVMAGTTG